MITTNKLKPTGNGMIYKGEHYRIGDTVEISTFVTFQLLIECLEGQHDEIWIGVIRQYYPFAEHLNVLVRITAFFI